jgi:hypothetical protein
VQKRRPRSFEDLAPAVPMVRSAMSRMHSPV